MKHESYTVGLIGCGNISRTHVASYRRRDCFEIAGVVDIVPENAERLQQDFEIPKAFTAAEDMLAEVQPDIVSICTCVDQHYPMLKLCAEAGVKGILCEKPFMNSPAELPLVKELLDRTGAKVVLGHMRRYGTAHIRARELFLGGEVGDPSLVMGVLAGADMGDMGTHWVDLIRYLNGDVPISSVIAQTDVGDRRAYGHACDDVSLSCFEFANGAKGVFSTGSGSDLAGEVYTMLIGTQGSIQIVHEDDLVISSSNGHRTEKLMDVYPDAWHALGLEVPDPWWNYKWDILFEEFLCWIEGGVEPGVGASNQFATAEAYLGAYLSALHGRRIEFPLSGENLKLDEWPVEELARRRERMTTVVA